MSEASGVLKLKVNNKKSITGQIGVRTQELPEGAKPEKDFDMLDRIINFKGNAHATIEVKIHDDD